MDFGSGFDLNSASAFGGVLSQPDQSTSSGDFWGALGSAGQSIGGLLSSAADAYSRVVQARNQPENTYRTYGSQQATDQFGLGTPQPGAPGGNGAVLWLVMGVVGAVLLLKYAGE